MLSKKTKNGLIAALACAAATLLAAPPAAAQPGVGVSVNIGQPGFYGRLDIGGGAPPPQLLYPQPILVQPPPPRVQQAPIYLRVPPEQARHWRRYCGRYDACGQPVYFVQDRWYREVYAPYWRERRHGPQRDWRDRRDWREQRDWRDERRHDRYDRRDDRRDEPRRWDDGPRPYR